MRPFKRASSKGFSRPVNQSPGILDDHGVRKNLATQEGTIERVPTNDNHIVNKKYITDNSNGFWTDSSTNTGTNKTLNSSTNDIHADSIHELLRNETGSTINKGDAVYISGYNVGLERALVTLADSTSSATMPCVALVEDSSIANNATGEFVEAGTLKDVNTNSWEVGDALWISTTATTGNTLTNSKPIGTTEIQKIGEVLRKHATRGIIEVFGAGRVNDLPNVATHTMSMGSNKITSVTDPTANQDAATKKYVDDNLHAKQHAINDAANHTSPLDPGQMIMANVITGLPNNATNTNVEVAGAVNHSTGNGSDHADVATNTAASHAESHNAASHSDITATGADIDDAVTKKHTAGTDPNDHAEAHNVASHSDTTGTGAELNTLTDGSVTVLHRHSKLTAPDGAPDEGIVVSNAGVVHMYNQCRFNAERRTAQSLTNADYTTIIFNTELYDEGSNYVHTTGIFTAPEAGYYAVSWSLLSANVGWGSGELFHTLLSKNDSESTDGSVWIGFRWVSHGTYTNYAHSNGSAQVYLAQNDTLRIKVYHNQGGAINCHNAGQYNFFHVHKLS